VAQDVELYTMPVVRFDPEVELEDYSMSTSSYYATSDMFSTDYAATVTDTDVNGTIVDANGTAMTSVVMKLNESNLTTTSLHYVTSSDRNRVGKYMRLHRDTDFRTDLTPSVLNRSATLDVAQAPARV
jgi:hypothetical protein